MYDIVPAYNCAWVWIGDVFTRIGGRSRHDGVFVCNGESEENTAGIKDVVRFKFFQTGQLVKYLASAERCVLYLRLGIQLAAGPEKEVVRRLQLESVSGEINKNAGVLLAQ